ncbi:MAG: twin-arginine translocation signal domain-containing protein [Hyphomicrobiaceae bacterium]|nr:MAG: twin-arginine translocation signal domain-containing protein [Hyphomicrobiaceae bacterium]
MNLTRRTFLQLMGALGAAVALKQDLSPKPEVAAVLDEPIASNGIGLFFRNKKEVWQRVGDVITLSGPSYEVELIDCALRYAPWKHPIYSHSECSASIMGAMVPELQDGFNKAKRSSFQFRMDDMTFEFDAYIREMQIHAPVRGLLQTDLQMALTGPIAVV